MYYWVIFLLASFIFLQAHSQSEEAIKEKARIFDLCRKQDGNLTESDVKDYYAMLSIKELSDHPCFILCVGREYDVIRPDNVLDMEKIPKVAARMWPRLQELPVLLEIVDYCITKTKKNPDACAYVFEQSDCCFRRLAEMRGAGQVD